LDINLLNRGFGIHALTNLDGGFLLSGYINGSHIGSNAGSEKAVLTGGWSCGFNLD